MRSIVSLPVKIEADLSAGNLRGRSKWFTAVVRTVRLSPCNKRFNARAVVKGAAPNVLDMPVM